MHESRERISNLDIGVLFVSFDTPEQLRQVLLAGVDLRFPLGIDPERETYHRWGLVRAPWWRIWLDPGVWIRYARLIRSGERVRGRGADPLQLGGDFVVAPDGRVAYARPQIRDDRPAVGELLAVASGLRRE
jgi:hypothetical protein